MRTIRAASLILVLFLIASCGKKLPVLQIPDTVQASFNSKYGTVKNIKWESTTNNGFKAVFKADQHLTKAYFDSTGNWHKTETELKSSEIPLVIMETVKNAFGGSRIRKSLKIDNSSGESTYILSLKKGNKITEVEFSTIGAILNPMSNEQ